eukprot:2074472-Amphidinium_carterae.2
MLARAADNCRGDREIVLTAISQCGCALKWADGSCRGDREIVEAAVKQSAAALQFASQELLSDSSFTPHARQHFCFLKLQMMSGRSCLIAVHESTQTFTHAVKKRSGELLGIAEDGIALYYGAVAVPDNAAVTEWPGPPSMGAVVEYDVVVTKRHRTVGQLALA